MSAEMPAAGEVWAWVNEPTHRLAIIDADAWDVTYRYSPTGREYSLATDAFVASARRVDDRM